MATTISPVAQKSVENAAVLRLSVASRNGNAFAMAALRAIPAEEDHRLASATSRDLFEMENDLRISGFCG